MELIVFVLVIVILWYVIGYPIGIIQEKRENKKIANLRAEKARVDFWNEKERLSKGIFRLHTKDNFYPFIGYPTNKEIYKFGEGLYYVDPKFSQSDLLGVDVKKGAVEDYFYTILLNYFPNEKISANKYRIRVAGNNYIPDFAYIDNSKGIYVDIEIDEPYSHLDKSIIHTQLSNDYRNKLFQRAGWAVIRFSEYQVVKYPQSCCKYIAKYLAYAYFDKKYLEDFTNVEDLSFDKMWSREEAEKYLQQNYRDNYLTRF